MNCPACHTLMVEEDFGGVKVDVCKNGCKGIWFDWLELSKLDEQSEGFGQALKGAIESSRLNDELRAALNCPKCSIPMQVHKYRHSALVNVDECYNCAGFFLDSGELSLVRDAYVDAEQEEEYVEQLLSGISEYGQAKKDLQKEQLRTEAVMHLTKYLRPSYYLNLFRERDR